MDHFENLIRAQASKASAQKPKAPSAQLMHEQRQLLAEAEKRKQQEVEKLRLEKIAELQSKLKKNRGSGSQSGRLTAPRREPERRVEQPKSNPPTQKIFPAKKPVIEVIHQAREGSKSQSGPRESEEEVNRRRVEAMRSNLNIGFLLGTNLPELPSKSLVSQNSQGSDDYDPLAPNSREKYIRT